MNASARKIRVAALTVISNTILAAMKLAVSLTIGSVSIISEAIHSGIDLIAFVIALIRSKHRASRQTSAILSATARSKISPGPSRRCLLLQPQDGSFLKPCRSSGTPKPSRLRDGGWVS